MKYIKLILIMYLIMTLLFIVTIITRTYPVVITNKISQHPHYYYPTTKKSYNSLLYGFFPFILEMSDSIKCSGIAIVNGKFEKVIFEDSSGITKWNYSGYHMLGNKVICIQ